MIKYINIVAFLSIIMLKGNVLGKPQDAQGTVILAIAQVKDTIDNGAAASDKKEIEFMGVKAKNDASIGFGDAARTKRSNRESEAPTKLSDKNMKRIKRFANTDNDDDYSENYDYSSSSSSSESEEVLDSA